MDGFIREISPVTTDTLVEKDQWLATLSASEIRAPIQAYIVALEVLDRTRNAASRRSTWPSFDVAAVSD